MNYKRNKTAEQKKNQNARSKRKQQIFGNNRSGHHQTSGNERKKNNYSILDERENFFKLSSTTEIFSKERFLKWTREELR